MQQGRTLHLFEDLLINKIQLKLVPLINTDPRWIKVNDC